MKSMKRSLAIKTSCRLCTMMEAKNRKAFDPFRHLAKPVSLTAIPTTTPKVFDKIMETSTTIPTATCIPKTTLMTGHHRTSSTTCNQELYRHSTTAQRTETLTPGNTRFQSAIMTTIMKLNMECNRSCPSSRMKLRTERLIKISSSYHRAGKSLTVDALKN